jgi:hypothetical protein
VDPFTLTFVYHHFCMAGRFEALSYGAVALLSINNLGRGRVCSP